MLFSNIVEKPTAKMVGILVKAAATRHNVMYNLYDRYMAGESGTPILTRDYYIGDVKQTDKINNKVNNDFFSEINDFKVGFLAGLPIAYTLDRKPYETVTESPPANADQIAAMGMEPKDKMDVEVSDAYDEDMQFIRDFNALNSIADLDAETVKRAAVCGFCGRLLYVEPGSGELKLQVLNPWECIFIGESIDSPLYAIRYFTVTSYAGDGSEIETQMAYLYDATTVQEFSKGKDDKEFTAGPTSSHMIPGVPMFGVANNDELQGDAEKVLNLIDAYDRTLSDVNSEVEQFRLAYMVFTGVDITPETVRKAQQTGAFSIPTGDGTVDFITKEMADAIIEHHLDRLESNIYRFSKTPNMKDINFGSNLTGVAMAFKFRPFEYKCVTAELKFKRSLRNQYKMLADIWNKRGAQIDYLDVDFIFTRNYPQNLLEEAQIQATLNGLVSDKTRLGLASFVEDPEDELDKMEKAAQSQIVPPLEQDDEEEEEGAQPPQGE